MKIQLLDLTIRDLVAGCHGDGEGGAHKSKRMSYCMSSKDAADFKNHLLR